MNATSKLQTKDNLNNKDNLKENNDRKKEDSLRNNDDLKNKDNLKRTMPSKMKTTSFRRLYPARAHTVLLLLIEDTEIRN